MMLPRNLCFLLRLVGGQTTLTWRRIFRGPLVRGWTVGEERLRDAGMAVDYREEPLLFHTFQSFGSQVPRADAAGRAAEPWVAERFGSA